MNETTTNAPTAKERAITFADALPDDTTATVTLVVDAKGQLASHGLGMSLHPMASMLVAGTIGVSEALVTEANGIAEAAKTLMSVNLRQALAALNPSVVIAAPSPEHVDIADPAAAPSPEHVEIPDLTATPPAA